MSAVPPSDAAEAIAVAVRMARGDFRLDLDVAFPAKGITAFFGPSGAGKTSSLRVLAGLDRGSGVVRAFGERWQDDAQRIFIPPHRRRIGFVFQNHALFSHLSVAGNVAYGRRRRRSDSPHVHRADEDYLLDLLDLRGLMNRRVEPLSGGERKRVAMAQALLAEPRLLLMDEPFSGIDDGRKSEIVPYLERIRDELPIPIVYVSHALDEVVRLASHLVIFDRGRVAASGPVGEMLSRIDLAPAFAGDAGAVVATTVTAHDPSHQLSRLAFDGGELWMGGLPHPVGAELRVRVLARDVSLNLERAAHSSIVNILPAVVLALEDRGPDQVYVRLAIGGGPAVLLARITRWSLHALSLRPGLAVYAQIKTVALSA